MERLAAAARSAKSRSVNRIVNSLVNTILKEKFSYKHTPEQIVLALNGAFKHPKLKLFLKSAGVVDVEELEAMKYNHQQIDCILMQTNASKKKSLGTDDVRIYEQSIFSAIADSPESSN